ncbi:hypothetical protein [Sinorhizobium fredii]|uniref:hypothetical protein n=1 Tax=Rhizobium fredii TaxID=380 RepID=UPI00351602EA
MYPEDRTIRRFLSTAPFSKSLVEQIRKLHPYSMLSDEEVYFLDNFCWSLPDPVRVAELGAYIGGTTSIFGAGTPSGSQIEVYDLFEHNPASRSRLKDDPLFEENSFFPIWERNTKRYRDKLIIRRGDVLETAKQSREPLDVLYIDIVKHPSLINVMLEFYQRLKVGGILMHQDYFHWQSPWIVYQMEHLLDHFDLIGDVGLNMTVYRKKREIPAENVDFLSFDIEQVTSLFDKAIARYGHSKAGMLRVSKLRLIIGTDKKREAELVKEVEETHGESPRVMRYLNELKKLDPARMW